MDPRGAGPSNPHPTARIYRDAWRLHALCPGGRHWYLTGGLSSRAARVSKMKRLLDIASVAYLLFSSPFHGACAAGPYDGEWTGSATATGGRCRPAIVTLTVIGTVVTGQAKMD